MTKWEYITTPLIIHNTTAILNNWGEQGWELVQIVQGPEGGLVAYLKREKGLTADIETIPVQKVNEAYERMLSGKARFRVVLEMQA